jgi:hypothetical protein
MALLLRVDGVCERFEEAKPAIQGFMERYCVEWLELSSRPVETGETPWLHKRLEYAMAEGEDPDPEHFDPEMWAYKTLAMVSETGRPNRLPANLFCKKLVGDIMVYTICVCRYDGSQYKCDAIPEMTATQLLQQWAEVQLRRTNALLQSTVGTDAALLQSNPPSRPKSAMAPMSTKKGTQKSK